MCGIFLYKNEESISSELEELLINYLNRIQHRGPDDTNYVTFSTVDMNTLSSSDLTQIQNTLTRNQIKTYIQHKYY